MENGMLKINSISKFENEARTEWDGLTYGAIIKIGHIIPWNEQLAENVKVFQILWSGSGLPNSIIVTAKHYPVKTLPTKD